MQAELEAAKEAALFDLYVRDVVATQIVPEVTVRKYYDDHPAEFVRPEQARVRLIFIGTDKHSVEEARALIGDVMKDLYGVKVGFANDPKAIVQAFAVRRASSRASIGGRGRGSGVGGPRRPRSEIANAVVSMSLNTVSGILETDAGVQLLLIEDRQPATKEPFESVRPAIREYLFGANVQKVMEAVNRTTNELRASSKVTLYPENVK